MSDRHGRGVTIAGVTIEGASLQRNHARVWGVLRDGRQHSVRLATLDSAGSAADEPGDDLVGTELEDGWWCKARVVEEEEAVAVAAAAPKQQRLKEEEEEGKAAAAMASSARRYLLCRGEGRRVEYKDLVQGTPADESAGNKRAKS